MSYEKEKYFGEYEPEEIYGQRYGHINSKKVRKQMKMDNFYSIFVLILGFSTFFYIRNNVKNKIKAREHYFKNHLDK